MIRKAPAPAQGLSLLPDQLSRNTLRLEPVSEIDSRRRFGARLADPADNFRPAAIRVSVPHTVERCTIKRPVDRQTRNRMTYSPPAAPKVARRRARTVPPPAVGPRPAQRVRPPLPSLPNLPPSPPALPMPRLRASGGETRNRHEPTDAAPSRPREPSPHPSGRGPTPNAPRRPAGLATLAPRRASATATSMFRPWSSDHRAGRQR